MALLAESTDMTDDGGHDARTTDFAPSSPIVPAESLSGRALFFVLAIMSFLACITVGAVAVVASAATDWRTEIAGEITVQVRPVEGLDMAAALEDAVAVLRATPGVASARALSDADLRNLLEPWLGAGADIDELPVPRLIVVEIDRAAPPDLADLRARLMREVPTSSLDDHELWQGRLAVMANTLVVSGLAILGLVLLATVFSVVFATRGAMATNRDIVEVLHLVGAKEAFIARQFERHFLRLGFRGGVAGGLCAVAAFVAMRWMTAQFAATPAGDQFDALFGALSVGWTAFLGIGLTVILVAALAAMTSRITVFRFLRVFD